MLADRDISLYVNPKGAKAKVETIAVPRFLEITNLIMELSAEPIRKMHHTVSGVFQCLPVGDREI